MAKKKIRAVYYKEEELNNQVERILSFCKRIEELLSIHEAWLCAARELGITKCKGIGELFVVTEDLYNLRLFQFYTLKNSRDFIRSYDGSRIMFKELELKKECALMRIQKIVDEWSGDDIEGAIHEISREEKSGAFCRALITSTKVLEQKVRNYDKSSTYIDSYSNKEKRVAKRDRVLKRTETLLQDLSKI